MVELYLGINQISPTGCVALGEALRMNDTLQKIDLQGMQMGPGGCLALSDAIRVNSTLTEIILDLDRATKEDVSRTVRL